MKTTIVCGMLGSGKTTFIKNRLSGTVEKTVVLVNDFAKAGIDGEIMSSEGIEAVELPSGCVCCTLKFDLITTIERVRARFNPQHLIIEPSGVAAVSGVIEALESAALPEMTVVGIIDATEFLELYEAGAFGSFFEDQIVNSDLLLINKTDLAESSVADRTARVLEDINPSAVIYRTVKGKMDCPLPDGRPREAVKPSVPFHTDFDTLSFTLRPGLAVSSVHALLDDLSCGLYGDVARAKALIETESGPFRFELSFGKVDAVRFDKAVGRSRLVVIGKRLDGAAIAGRTGSPVLL